MKRVVMVVGATGQQGGAVVDALLSNGHDVRAVTRNPESASAQGLATRGVHIFKADLKDADALTAAMSGVDTVFAVTTPFEEGVQAETEQGLTLIEAAGRAGVGHFIFSSVSDANRKTGIPHFESKFSVEEALKNSAIPYTIVAPVYFMDNVHAPFMAPSAEGVLSLAMPSDRPLQQIAVEDIGRFVALVVDERERLFGRRIDIAGAELTGEAMAEILSQASGRSISYNSIPTSAVRAFSEDMALMFEWFDAVGYSADIAALRSEFPGIEWQDYRTWAEKETWSQ